MLREQLIGGVSEVVDFLESTGIYKMVVFPKEVPATDLFSTVRQVAIAEQSLSPAARQIISILNIEDLLNPAFWAEYIGTEKGRSERVSAVRFRLRFVKGNLPKIIDLLKRGSDKLHEVEATHWQAEGYSEKVKLTLILPEGDRPSSPKRVSMALDGLSEIYFAISSVRKVEENTLALVSCDSGSDKVFDFAGIGEVLREVKELILALWDRTIYYKQKKTKESLDAIGDALPILAEIGRLKESGAISPEQAEILRRGITNGLIKLVDAGAMIPEMVNAHVIDARALAAPSQKLLAGPVASDTEMRKDEQQIVEEDAGFEELDDD